MEKLCKELGQYDEESLSQLDPSYLEDYLEDEINFSQVPDRIEDEPEEMVEEDSQIDESSDIELDRRRKAVRGSYKKAYGRTKRQLDAENRHILSTQAKCLKFVKRHRDHHKVCTWCRRAPAPKLVWKWVTSEGVWYRYYDGKWNYWGISKRGFT